MHAACGGERRKKGLAGAPSHCLPDSVPQTPAGDCASCTSASVRLRRRAKKKKIGWGPFTLSPRQRSPDPGRRTTSPCTPCFRLNSAFFYDEHGYGGAG